MKSLVANRYLVTRLLNLALGKSLGPGATVVDVPIPSISPDEILVKVKAVALNPTDFKHVDIVSPPHSIVGCDFAGEVFQVGDNAAARWKVGDRVAGGVHGGLYSDRGAFAEYLKVPADLAWKVPAGVKDAEAATYGVSAVSAMLALNVRLELPWADDAKGNGGTVLIYAGSTSAGLFSIQLAKAAGYTVVTTASPHSFALVKEYGADAAFDYRSPTVADDIIKDHPGISHAMDCFSEGKSTEICAKVLEKSGGTVVTLLPGGESKTPGVKYDMIMAYTVFGRAFRWLPPVGPKFPAVPENRAALVRFYQSLPGLVGTVKAPPITLVEGGLDGILAGLDKLRAGQVSGGKLVVEL